MSHDGGVTQTLNTANSHRIANGIFSSVNFGRLAGCAGAGQLFQRSTGEVRSGQIAAGRMHTMSAIRTTIE